MNKELSKIYNPQEVEDRIYSFWLSKNYFHAQIDECKRPYTIVIPPPNITGQLHMGHALDNTLQDILIRFKRMHGYSALWLPGIDHAAIATEAKIVEVMRQEGISKESLGRDGFMERAWAWKEKYGGRIIEQLKKLGSSCDWERERFTMDDTVARAVNEVFLRLYEKGLIYRGERIINWCPKCKTSISDAEVDFKEKDGNFWHLRYPVTDGSGYIELATTRPETMLGDTAVAVHPDDERYKHLIGKTVTLPLVGREIPVIADNYVEPEFGTGVVKITPAHDPNDFEVGERHNLPIINVMDETAVMNENSGKYQGLDRYEARKIIVKDLQEGGFLVKVEPIKHNVGSCYRCSSTVEPRISKQWFVKMEPLARPAIKSVEDGDVKFVPDRFKKVYFNWLNNIKDWCISRQLWWGHRIPAWYCSDCGETIVSRTAPDKCMKCGSKNLHQDEDTLDTWFSSALWPFATLGWPEKTPDFEYFYPTDTLVTGYDIIFFWVVRMVFSALEYTGKAPFKSVLIHGLVRDEEGRKMSKSLGNGIDPLEVVEKYGADALRFALTTGNGPGNDMRFSVGKVEASRNFINKIWNAARFIHMNIEGYDVLSELPPTLAIEEKWIINLFNNLTKEVNENIEKFELGIAAQKLYDFVWDSFCDWYIEFAKTKLQSGGNNAKNARQVLVWVMTNSLKLLHPFIPYITEEIWQTMPHSGESIMVSDYPKYDENLSFPQAENDMLRIMDAIRAIRNRRAEMNVPPSKKAHVYIATNYVKSFFDSKLFINKLAYASDLSVANSFNIPDSINIVTDDVKIYIPMDELIDKQAEIIRLQKELESAESELNLAEGKLANKGFVSNAPEKVVENVRQTAKKMSEKIQMIKSSMESLSYINN